MPSPVRLRSAAVSETGAYRTVNQDAAFTSSWAVVVADGVGGGPSGDLASASLVHRVIAGGARLPDADALAVRIRGANWELRAHVDRDEALRGMATTFTGVFVSEAGSLLIAHTGDSRAYRFSGGELTRQTRDDSFVQTLVDSGVIAPEAAATHPHRNVITASLHGAEDDAVSVAELPAHVGDRWLVCSDGVTDYVSDQQLAAYLASSPSVEQAAADIAAAALAAASRDNVTAAVFEVEAEREVGADAWPAVFHGAAAGRFCEQLDPV